MDVSDLLPGRKLHQHDIGWLSRVYLLLNQSCPQVLEELDYNFPNQVVVAANLLEPEKQNEFFSTIISDSNSRFHFALDLTTKKGSSKGDWIWITQVNISVDNLTLLSIPMGKRVIDIPYFRNRVSANCLFNNFRPELLSALQNTLYI